MIHYKNAIKLDESGFKGKKNENKQKISHNLVTLTSKSKMKALLKKHWLQPSEFQKNSWKQLIYANAISAEITIPNAKTTKNQVVRNIVPGEFMEKLGNIGNWSTLPKKLGQTETIFFQTEKELAILSISS